MILFERLPCNGPLSANFFVTSPQLMTFFAAR